MVTINFSLQLLELVKEWRAEEHAPHLLEVGEASAWVYYFWESSHTETKTGMMQEPLESFGIGRELRRESWRLAEIGNPRC